MISEKIEDFTDPTCRYESNSGGEREIQRTMLELLNQLDGFDSRGDVKVIMATNRIESLDPALIRAGEPKRLTCCQTLILCLAGRLLCLLLSNKPSLV